MNEALHIELGEIKWDTLQWLSLRKILPLKGFAVPPVLDSLVCSSWKMLANRNPLVSKLLVGVYQNFILLIAPRLPLDCWV